MLETLTYINSDFPIFATVMVFVFGAIVGSFLNVCIYRIPKDLSIVRPGSSCACGSAIAWYHNIPIFSWCLLRGRSTCCREWFSIRYPLVEFLTASLFAYAWWVHSPIVAIIGMLYLSFLICSTFIDLDHMIIPDRFSIGGMILGVFISFFFPILHGIQTTGLASSLNSALIAISGVLVGSGLVYWIAVLGEVLLRKPAMGEGDVKFVGFIGAFCGWQGAVFAMFGGALIGSILLLPLIMFGRIIHRNKKASQTSSESMNDQALAFGAQVPFGPMLAVAALIYFLGFNNAVDTYLKNASDVFCSSLPLIH